MIIKRMLTFHVLALLAASTGFGCGGTGTVGPDQIQVNGLADGHTGQAYSQQLRVTGGVAPYRFQLASGSLPPGLSLVGDMISGTPSQAGQFGFQILVDDSDNPPVQFVKSLSIFIHSSTPGSDLAIFTATLPSVSTNQPYDARVLATGGTSPYAFELVDGSLPAGLSLNASSGKITGASSETGHHVFDVRVSDANSASVVQRLNINISSTDADRPRIDANASLLSGPAPLHVFFDARKTTSPRYPRAFHHLTYRWNYGELDATRRSSTGPIAAHTFVKPGQHIVQLAVIDPDGRTSTQDFTIQVEDPDKFYAGNKTYCFSNDTDFTGAPAGAIRVTTDQFSSSLSRYAGANRRFLFKRGDVFQAGYHLHRSSSRTLVSAFGEGTNPDERGIYANNPVIRYADNNAGLGLIGEHLMISQVNFSNPQGGGDTCFVGSNSVKNFHTHRCRIEGFKSCAVVDGSQASTNPTYELFSMVDCYLVNPRYHGVYGGGHRFAVIGCRFDMATPASHHVRITFADGYLVDRNQFNNLRGSGHAVKAHADHNRALLGRFSKGLVIRKNVFDVAVGWTVAVAPQSHEFNEEVIDVIIEKNTFYSKDGCATNIYLACRDVSVRNNLFLGAGSTGSEFYAVQITRRGIEPEPAGIEIYNNTRYNTIRGASRDVMVDANNHQGPVIVRNNIVYATPGSGSRGVASTGGSTVTASGNFFNDPDFENPTSLNFRLKSGSSARGKGVDVPVRDDRDGLRRLATPNHPGCHGK